ncbi:MAG: PocR ligand-binding domain-containing protein, partial [Bacteroidales bacterium]|nr:PocR ligand-binding domain-containing protein [Bacteroidales bacterium]
MKNELLNIIDFERVNSLLEGFNQTTGYVTAILDLEGNVLSKSGWREICTKFHRTHPETNKKCTISDTVLANKLADGEKYHHYKCLNGLVDVAVPLILKGEHVANLFTGQFFFEKPDTSLFLRQAEKYGFDKKEYLAALENVPVITEEKARVAIAFLLNMTNLISNLSVQKMQQKILAEQLKSSEERWQFALEGSGDGVWDWNTQTNKVFFSKRWKEMLGYEENEIADNVDEWEKRIHPDDKENCYLDLNKHFNGETDFYSNEHRVLCKDGSYKWILDRGKVISWIEEKKPLRIIGTHVDLTEHKLAEEKIRESQEYNRILFDLSVIGLAVTTMEGKLIDVNKTYAEIIGRTIEETKLLTYWEITPKKYAEQEQQQLDSLEKTGRYGPYEKEY